ncbi:DUF3899 domain-containing protein [Rubeoparvulum massiliense]|uniref:DUF3899 domain-containing protein n=1 Tax=Rubeoparvulum massiliense TaxID=1631346 RepID=UPI00065DF2C8|nr:DUF3899 domain-containing protein [Rubeoparvulum massiliense]
MLDSKLFSRLLAPLFLLAGVLLYAWKTTTTELLVLHISNTSFMVGLLAIVIVAIYTINHGGFFSLFKKSWQATKIAFSRNPYMRKLAEDEKSYRKSLDGDHILRKQFRMREWFFFFPLVAGVMNLILSVITLTLL